MRGMGGIGLRTASLCASREEGNVGRGKKMALKEGWRDHWPRVRSLSVFSNDSTRSFTVMSHFPP
jgi:hypothetical protein